MLLNKLHRISEAYIATQTDIMSHSPLFSRANHQSGQVATPILIVGVFVLAGIFFATMVLLIRKKGNKAHDLEAQRAQQRQPNTRRHGQPGRATPAERRTRQTREARETQASSTWESGAETQTRWEERDTYWESAPPMYQPPARTLATPDARRQRAPLSRPLPDLPTIDSNTPPPRTQPPTPSLTTEDWRRQRAPLSRELPRLPSTAPNRPPKYEAPPAYDSVAVWSSGG